MRIAVVQAYPSYHDHSVAGWLAKDDRDKWIPGLLASLGHEVELWAGAWERLSEERHPAGMGAYTLRLFPTQGSQQDQGKPPRSKQHWSPALIEHAQQWQPQLCFIKGVDGNVGLQLIHRYLHPLGRPYVLVIGGRYYHADASPEAAMNLLETPKQERRLQRKLQSQGQHQHDLQQKLCLLPKSVDTEHFKPTSSPKRWDVLGVGRLIPRSKNYRALGRLSKHCSVAIAGDGPLLTKLKQRYPAITWLGHVPHAQLPEAYNAARLFMHSGCRDYFPRVLSEAAACGIPCLVFRQGIEAGLLPQEGMLRLSRWNYLRPTLALLNQPEARRQDMGLCLRNHVLRHYARDSTRATLIKVLQQLNE